VGRSELDLDHIDAILDALTPTVGDGEDLGEPDEEHELSPLHVDRPARYWWSDPDPQGTEHHARPVHTGPRPPRPRYRASARPQDLPPLQILPGYRRDPRGTWRYHRTGVSVPGARDITLGTLHRYARNRPDLVQVPDDSTRLHPELEWCRATGELVILPSSGHAIWEIELHEWEERALWPLGLTAPELAPDRLVTVDRLARFLGGVSSSTITSYLARGRLPEPQVRIGSRPAWSAPIILDWFRER
jgi:predicted DNA-binding transcriptional regulator AlpA